MNILITGGAGYIGSHCCKALASRGFIPVVYDNLCRGHRSFVQWGPFEYGDILDRARLSEVIRKYQPAAVMHFAALTSVGESVADPATYFRNNIVGSLTLLETMRIHGIQDVILSSTAAVYGMPEIVPIVETCSHNPINPYGRAKLVVEEMAQDFARAYGFRVGVLRYFNACGADADGEVGESHDPETHLIPLILAAAKGTNPVITIFGNDYDTADGTCVRDYVHVADLAEAHHLVLDSLLTNKQSCTYNVGNGQGFSVLEVIEAARRVTGLPVPVKMARRRAGDPPFLIADHTRIKTELGWEPIHSGLTNILQTAWNWMNHEKR